MGIKVNGVFVNNIRYSDGSFMIADSAEDLKQMIDQLNIFSYKYGPKLNCNKTKLMIACGMNLIQTNAQIIINNATLERASYYKYLGSWTKNGMTTARLDVE